LLKNFETPEQSYTRTTSREHRRRFGQVFTPPRIAELMADWVCEVKSETVVDPAYGTGVLARAIWNSRKNARVIGYEIDPVIFEKATESANGRADIRLANFLVTDVSGAEAFIANPPYIRHRELIGSDRARNELSSKAGYMIPKSANLYVYFCTKMLLDLSVCGRAAIIIPSEWMNANFSTGFKGFLKESGMLKHIVSFSHCSDLFEGALTTASILLLEKPQ